MSSARPPEFFLDRSLGRTPAQRLRDAGDVIHLIADHYPDDANEIPDADWIAELAALDGQLFCLADGNLNSEEMADRLLRAVPAITRAIAVHDVGFWHVHAGGEVALMWP